MAPVSSGRGTPRRRGRPSLIAEPIVLRAVERPPAAISRPEAGEVQVSCIRSFDALEARRRQWDALLQRSASHTVFQTFEWHASWWRAYGADFELFVLWAERNGELVGVAPLMLAERRLLWRRHRVLHFIGLYSSDYCDFIVDEAEPQVLSLMLRWLANNRQTWDALDLRNVQDSSPTVRVVPEYFAQHGYPVDVRPWSKAPTRVFGDEQADRDLLRKKSLKRNYNHFKKNGRLEFVNYKSVPEIMHYLDAFFGQHVDRWGATDTPSQFLDEQHRAFFRDMVGALAPTGSLLFSAVLFDDRPIAFHLGFEYEGRLIWYKPTFETALARHSPGEVLLKYLIEYAHGRGLIEFDFACGEEAFKYRFANHARSIYTLQVFQDRLFWRFDRLKFEIRTFIKGSPALVSFGRRFLSTWYHRIWY
jgi:CelD/BcsL family acetyltransferase involved in cellulose biosynthesis